MADGHAQRFVIILESGETMMHKIIGNEKAAPEALKQMRESLYNFPDTRWAAYQNVELGHPQLGHLKFLAVGPHNTLKEASERLPDTPREINWRYYLVGFISLETGDIGA
jgi:hypothetical protein